MQERKKKEKIPDPEFDGIKRRRNLLRNEYNERVKNMLDRTKTKIREKYGDDEASQEMLKEEFKKYREAIQRQLNMRVMANEIEMYNNFIEEYSRNNYKF